MTKSTITDKRVASVIDRLGHYACNLKWTNVRGAQDLLAAADGLRELQERRKAAMDGEPVAEVEAEFKVRPDDRMMYPPTCCHKHPETVLQVHPFEQLMSHPPQPKMYCPECEPGVAEWAERDKQFRQGRR
ncbi:hypothetical protein [Klebsiella quasivariicola]|uniref:hypothetical protein n=1 Tax=Klebsiella quasivariicola TaxID=2026240 RepID=UPI002B056C19|nr:hypothetical protein [Klebsiella quasivariicola]